MPHDLLRSLATTLLLAALAAAPAAAAEQVELHLVGGKVVIGELISEAADKVVVKSTMATKSGPPMSITKEYQRAEISELVRVQDPETTYATRAAAAKSATEHAELAAWCRDHAMTERAVEQARAALALDAAQGAAAKLLGELGWVKVDQDWVKESEWLAKQGKVRYQDRVMTIAEADQLKAAAKLEQARKAAQQAVDDKTAALATLDRDIEKLPKRPAEIDAEIAKDTAAMKVAQAASDRVTITKSALAAAEKNLADAKSQGGAGAGGAGQHGPGPGGAGQHGPGAGGAPSNNNNNAQNLAPLQQAVDDAQKAANSARHDAAGADQEFARLKAAIVTLTDEKKNLDKKGTELKARREALAKELDEAKAALDAATKKAADATTPPAATP
jgi:hypothetical protein